MNRSVVAAGMFAMAVALASAVGCRAKHEIYLNPDGTGKMVVETSSDGPEDAGNSESQLVYTSGIAAWTAVSRKTEGETSTFQGTALFTDLNKTRIGVFVNRNADGNPVIEVRRPEGGPTSRPGSITDEKVKAMIAELRTEFEKEKSRNEVKQATAGRWDIRIHVPGQVVSVKQFKRAADGALEVSFEGKKLLDAMSKIMADDKALTDMIREGESPKRPGQMFDGLLLRELFGSTAPIRAEIKPSDKPLFDFKAEVAAAGGDWLNKALIDAGLIPAKLPDPDPAAGEVTVQGVKAMPRPSLPREKQTMNIDLTVKPADKGSRVTQVELYRVLDGNDKLVLPAVGAHRSTGFYGQPPADGVYSMGISVPMVTTATIKEISGVARAYIVKGTREVDLGTVELKTGAKGAAMGFELAKCEKKDTSVDLTCKFDKAYPLTRLVVKNESGKEIKSVEQNATKPRDTHYLYAFNADKWPDKVRFVAVIAEGTQAADIPFRLKDVKLPESKDAK